MVVITRVVHSVNGKKYGMFYHFADGRCVYMAWRSGAKSRSLFFQKNAWCMDIATLREAERRGATAVGIAHRVGTTVHFYITNIRDFWGPASESHPEGTTPQRRLGRDRFLVNTSKSAGSIAKAMKLR